MNNITKLYILLVLIVLSSCSKTERKNQEEFVLSGTLHGITNGKVVLDYESNGKLKKDTAIIENGQFTIKGNFPEPTFVYLRVCNKEAKTKFYAENSNMKLIGHIDSLRKASITGGKCQDDINKFYKGEAEVLKDYNQDKINEELSNEKTSEKRKEELNMALEKCRELKNEYKFKFLKENPSSYFSAMMIKEESHGKSAAELEELLLMLDKSLSDKSIVVEMRRKLEEMKKNNVTLDEFVSEAPNVDYKLGKFNGESQKGIVYLGVFKNNNVCALKENGTISIVDPNGEEIRSFNLNLKGDVSAVAVDQEDGIYVLAVLKQKIVKKIRGRKITKFVASGSICAAYNQKGEKFKEFKLKDIIHATGIRVVDGKIFVSDASSSKLGIFNAKTGELSSVIEGLRPCCGILDFSIRNKNEILVANLGAFKVQSYDFNGKNIIGFGKRGKEMNNFHGCCNPVSVAYLSNGAIVTVEKDPTRVKIYSKEGAKLIAGIEEMVKGCQYIPMIVDYKDNLYLASKEKGLIKCVVENGSMKTK